MGFNKLIDQKENDILRIFVKIDYVHHFFTQMRPNCPYILVTHNGDLAVNGEHNQYLEDPKLIKWYGQNIDIEHPKLFSIPIGIANEKWPHGDENIFFDVLRENRKKENLVYSNFDVRTNPVEREKCLSALKAQHLPITEKVPFKTYLQDLASSYFVISPNGNGIDCHKTWESLYLKSIPVVTRSINSNFYQNLPILIIESWEKFDASFLSVDLYKRIWKDFKIDNLKVGNYAY